LENSLNILAPISGKVIELTAVNDPVFSQKMMGDGFGIIPSGISVVSPVTGTVTFVAETKHAIGLTTSDGAEILVHMGLDTVELKGVPFSIRVKVNDKVTAGHTIATMNLTNYKGNDDANNDFDY